MNEELQDYTDAVTKAALLTEQPVFAIANDYQ